jgi:hypothetical protein
MNIIQTAIPDVLIVEPEVFSDARGFFYESFNKKAMQAMGIAGDFVQDNHLRKILLTGKNGQLGDEYHQLFVPGRDASGWDILADGLGGFLAASILFRRDRRIVKISQDVFPGEKKHAPCATGYPAPGGGEEG